MKRATPFLFVWIAALIALAVYNGTIARSQVSTFGGDGANRYSTQWVVLPGDLGAGILITDHQAQRTYLYTTEDDHLELRQTIDLTKAGEPTIAFASTLEPPATRPSGLK